MATTKTTPYYKFTTILSITWYVIFFGFLAFNRVPTILLGALAWPMYVVVLSLLSTFVLMVFFLSLVNENRPAKWNFWLLINSLLVCAPLYFLWWNYLQ